jgi:hypothetical protein
MTSPRSRTACLIASVGLPSSVALAAPPPEYKGGPFADEFHQSGPPAIPGVVQCALYDLGGEGVAYHDTTKENEGSDVLNRDPDHERAHAGPYVWHFRRKEGVDLSYVKDGRPAATGRVPRATESWHHWDYGPIGSP